MTQEELRSLYKERLKKEKQIYIAEMTGISTSVLSKFKTEKIDLYPHLYQRLEAYLTQQ